MKKNIKWIVALTALLFLAIPLLAEESTFIKKVTMSGSFRARAGFYQLASQMDSFGLSRSRIKLTGEVAPQVSFLVQPDFAGLSSGGTVALTDAYMELKFDPITFRLGQFLIPFAYDSGKYKTIFSTGFVPSHYGVVMPARDYGIRAMGGLPFISELTYDVAFVNGTGGVDTNKSKDLVGRIAYKNSILELGVSGYSGKAGTTKTDKSDVAVDLELKFSPCQLVAEYVFGHNTAASVELQETSIQLSGIFETLEPLIRYESYDPNIAQSGNISNTLTLGLGYLFDKVTKLIVNYNIVAEETTAIDNNSFLMEVQAQI
jgi:predicted porin